MKKILIFSQALWGTGGLENVISILDKHIDREKIDLSILIEREVTTPENFKVANYKVLPSSKLKRLKLYSYLKKMQFDAVICTGPKTLRYLLFCIKFLFKKPKIIIWNHSRLKQEFNNRKNLKNFLSCDYYLALCSEIRDQYIKAGVDRKKVFITNNPVKKQLTTTINGTPNSNYFLYIGRLAEDQKKISYLIWASYILKSRNINFKVTIVGKGPDAQMYRDMVKTYALEENIIFFDFWLKNPFDIVNQGADALILPSNYEGLPLILLEAMSYGIPCISSNCETGPRDIIQVGINGLIYDKDNIFQLVDCMTKIINKEIIFERNKIKTSINQYYINNYIKNMENILLTVASPTIT